MFYVFQRTITPPLSSPRLQQLSWYFNPGIDSPVATAWGDGECACPPCSGSPFPHEPPSDEPSEGRPRTAHLGSAGVEQGSP